jgi:hypothetical protein
LLGQISAGIVCFKTRLFRKGVPPVVAPEGDLVFGEKAELPLTLFKRELHICTADWGAGYVQKDLEILSKGRSDIAVGCSKRW